MSISERRKQWLLEHCAEFDLPSDFKKSSSATPFKRIYVLTLPQRLEHVLNFLRKNGFVYENVSIFRAIDKNTLDFGELEELGFVDRESELRSGEIACALSQMAIYMDFISIGSVVPTDWCCIFEDDNEASIPDVETEVGVFVEKVNKLVRRKVRKERRRKFYELPNLHYLGFCYCNKEALNKEILPGVCQSLSHFCTHGYFFNRAMVNYFFEKAEFPMAKAIDHVLRDMFISGDVVSFFSSTNLFQQNRIDLPSEITDREENMTFVDGDPPEVKPVFVLRGKDSGRLILHANGSPEPDLEEYETNVWVVVGISLGLVLFVVFLAVGIFVYAKRNKQYISI